MSPEAHLRTITSKSPAVLFLSQSTSPTHTITQTNTICFYKVTRCRLLSGLSSLDYTGLGERWATTHTSALSYFVQRHICISLAARPDETNVLPDPRELLEKAVPEMGASGSSGWTWREVSGIHSLTVLITQVHLCKFIKNTFPLLM